MTRLMWDSTTAADIPAGAEMVAGYVDGKYAWSAADWQRWAHVPQVRICVTGDPAHGDCLDVETGDATPAQAAAWVRARHKAGVRFVTIYANRSTMTAVDRACRGLSYFRWVATLDGTMRYPQHPDAAVQFAGQAMTGVHADASVVYNDHWHPAKPAPQPWVAGALTEAKALVKVLSDHA